MWKRGNNGDDATLEVPPNAAITGGDGAVEVVNFLWFRLDNDILHLY